MKRFNKESGRLGLLEMLIVVAIIGVLAMVFLPGFAQKARAEESADQYRDVPASTNICGNVQVGTNSTLILSNDTYGVGAFICNDSGNTNYLSIGTPMAAHQGIVLPPGQCRGLPYPTISPVYGISVAGLSNNLSFCLGKK